GGVLVDATARSLPTRSDETREIRAGDVDSDGDLDLLIANVQFGMRESPEDYLLYNDGSGVFSTAPASAFPSDQRSNFTVQLLDVDHDGDLDVLSPSTVFPRNESAFLVLFATDAEQIQVASAPIINISDVDGDGDLDVLVSDD